MRADLCPHLIQTESGFLRIWDEPLTDAHYIVGVDVAEGRVRDRSGTQRKVVNYRDDRPDYSAAVVVEQNSGVHVATWHGHIEPTEFAIAVCALAMHYNTALLVPELNGPGIAVIETLSKTLEYPNIYRSKIFNKIDADPLGSELGWRTTLSNRPILMARIEETLNYGRLFTRDAQLISELRTMEIDPNGVPRARGKHKDDIVIALALALQGRFEALHGTVVHEVKSKLDRLPAYDRKIWERIAEKNKQVEDAKRRVASGRPMPLARLRRMRSPWGGG